MTGVRRGGARARASCGPLIPAPELDAIYCGSDLIARGVTDALTEAGVSVPDDIAVVGTDNWALIARAARPPLTTVDMRLGEVGRRAAHFLIAAIDGHEHLGSPRGAGRTGDPRVKRAAVP